MLDCFSFILRIVRIVSIALESKRAELKLLGSFRFGWSINLNVLRRMSRISAQTAQSAAAKNHEPVTLCLVQFAAIVKARFIEHLDGLSALDEKAVAPAELGRVAATPGVMLAQQAAELFNVLAGDGDERPVRIVFRLNYVNDAHGFLSICAYTKALALRARLQRLGLR